MKIKAEIMSKKNIFRKIIFIIAFVSLISLILPSTLYSLTDQEKLDIIKKKHVNLNEVNEKLLQQIFALMGIDKKIATEIVKFRTEEYLLSSPKDLLNVKGITEEMVDKIMQYLVIVRPEIKAQEVAEEEGYSDDEEADYVDELNEFKLHPLDINKATRGDLGVFPFLSPLDAMRIVRYIEDNGALKNIDDLDKVPGITPEKISQLKPYITIKVASKVFDFKQMVSGGAGFNGFYIHRVDAKRQDEIDSSKRLGNSHYNYDRITMNFGPYFTLEAVGTKKANEKGYWPTTLIEAFITNQGVLDNYNKYSASLLNLYDRMHYNFQVHDLGPIKMIAIGDYQLSYGQGLTFASSGASMIGNMGKSPIKKKTRGIKPQHSPSKAGVLRGGAVDFKIWKIRIGLFYSQMWYDASLADGDSDDNDQDGIKNEYDDDSNNDGKVDSNNLPDDADHEDDCLYSIHGSLKSIITGDETFDTDSASEKRNKLAERLIGGHFDINIKEIFTFGVNAYYSQYWVRQYPVYDRVFHPTANKFNKNQVVFDPEIENNRYYAFRGNQLTVASIYFDAFIQNLNIYGSLGTSIYPMKSYQAEFSPKAVHNADSSVMNIGKYIGKKNDSDFAIDWGWAGTIGVYLDLEKVDFSALFYNAAPNFYSPHGSVFSDVEAQWGFFQGVQFKLSPKAKFTLWLHFYKENWRTWDHAYPVFYTKSEFNAIFKPWRKVEITGKIQYTQNMDNLSVDDSLVDTSVDYSEKLVLFKKMITPKFSIQWDPIPFVRLKLQYQVPLGLGAFERTDQFGAAHLLAATTKLSPHEKINIVAQIGVYHTFITQGWTWQVYLYEYNPPEWAAMAVALSGTGFRSMIMLTSKILKKIEVSVKYLRDDRMYQDTGTYDDYYKYHNFQFFAQLKVLW